MADDVTYSTTGSSVPLNTKQVTDEHVTRGHMPVVKMAYSADGSATLVTADADGLLVNLGANNDVTVTGSVDATNAAFDVVGGGAEAAALRVTLANDSTGVLSVDDNGGSLTVDGSVTANAGTNLNTSALALESGGNLAGVRTAVELIDDTVAVLGTATYTETTSKGVIMGAVRRDADTTLVNTTNEIAPLQVDANGYLKVEIFDGGGSHTVDGTVTANLAAGTNNIGDVDVLTVVTGTGATNLGKAVDAVAGATDTGVAILAIRDDALTTLTPVDGDYVNLRVNSTGALHVTGGGGGTEYTVNAAAPADPTGATFVMERDDQLSTLTEIEGDWTNPRATSKGALWVALADNAGDPITSFGGGTQYTQGDVDATITGTAMLMEGAGDTLVPAQGTVADGLLVNLGANNDVTVAGVSTAANQTTIIGHIDGIEGQLTNIVNDLASIEPTVTLFGASSYVEDLSYGLYVAAVRRDADTTLVSADGEAGPLQMDANGRLKVEVFSGETLPVSGTVTANLAAGTNNIGDVDILSIAAGDNNIGNVDIVTMPNVTNGGTFVVQENGAALTALQLIDDTVTTLGTTTYTEATSKGIAIGAVRRDADTTLVNTTNEFGPLQMDANGRLKVEAFSGETLPVSLTSTTVTGTVAVTQSGTWDEVGINDSGNSITVDNGGTFATQIDGAALTALQLIDDSIFADDAAFTLASSKTSVAGAIRDDSLTTLTAIEGDVVPLRVSATGALHVTGGGGGTEYTEDAAAAADPVGGATILVRADTPATITSTNGDNVAQRGTNYGAAYTQIVTSAGAFVDTFGGGTQYTQGDTDATISGTAMLMEGAADTLVPAQGTVADGLLVNLGANNDVTVSGTVTANAGTNLNTSFLALETGGNLELAALPTKLYGTSTYTEGATYGAGIAAVRRDADTTLVTTDNEFAPLQVDANGRLKVEVFSGEALPITDNGGSITIDNSQLSSINTSTLWLPETIKVLGLDTYTEGSNAGTIMGAVRRDADTTLASTTNEFAPLQVDANGRLKVEVFSGETLPVSGTVTANLAAGTNNIGDVDVLTMPNVTLAAGTNTNEVVGDVAHSVAAAGNPILNAGIAQNGDDTAPPNRVDAEGDATRLATDWDGCQYVRPHGPQVWTYHSNGSVALTDATVHAAPGAGLSLYVGTITFSSGAATAINMFLEEGASTVMGPYYLEATAGRGMSVQFNPPRKITVNTALTVTTSAAIAHSVDITGFTAQG
jgi:hypothetical protein